MGSNVMTVKAGIILLLHAQKDLHMQMELVIAEKVMIYARVNMDKNRRENLEILGL